MLFNSFEFLVFFSIVFTLFYLGSFRWRPYLLFISSCLFYMWFIPIYILILFLTIAIDYFAAQQIEDSTTLRRKKNHLLLGILNTCVVLFFFKYYNFFVENLQAIGIEHVKHWTIILPIGLSFHVFQSLSYVIEVYRGNIKAERNLLTYSNYVMLFPQLVAGPIERAQHLLPQLRNLSYTLDFSNFQIGFTRFIWGLFKKVAVADLCSIYVDAVYNNYNQHSGSTLALATFLFAIQIYCDFSGYSDMAIGVARILGIHFNENFKIPYFSKSITEFWRRWHISLSSWLRDYIYISLGGNKKGKFQTYRNLLLTMLIGGLWHGASWNFVIWGGLNGLYLSFEKLLKFPVQNPINFHWKILRAIYVFILISFSWIFFRSSNFDQAKYIITQILFYYDIINFQYLDISVLTNIICMIFLLLLVEYTILRKTSFDVLLSSTNGLLKITVFNITIIILILLFGYSEGGQFIYFQF